MEKCKERYRLTDEQKNRYDKESKWKETYIHEYTESRMVSPLETPNQALIDKRDPPTGNLPSENPPTGNPIANENVSVRSLLFRDRPEKTKATKNVIFRQVEDSEKSIQQQSGEYNSIIIETVKVDHLWEIQGMVK